VTTVLENINQKMHSTLLHARAHKYKRLLEQTRKAKKDREEAIAGTESFRHSLTPFAHCTLVLTSRCLFLFQ
jgi:hypothetical protein